MGWGKSKILLIIFSENKNASSSRKQNLKLSSSWNIQNIPVDLLIFQNPFCMTKRVLHKLICWPVCVRVCVECVCGHLVLKRPSGKIRIFKPDLCTLQKKRISCWEMSTCPNQSATLKPDKCSASHMRRPHKAKWNVATQFIVILRHEKLLHYVKMSWKCRYDTLKHSFASSEKAFRFDTLFVFCNVCFLQVENN